MFRSCAAEQLFIYVMVLSSHYMCMFHSVVLYKWKRIMKCAVYIEHRNDWCHDAHTYTYIKYNVPTIELMLMLVPISFDSHTKWQCAWTIFIGSEFTAQEWWNCGISITQMDLCIELNSFCRCARLQFSHHICSHCVCFQRMQLIQLQLQTANWFSMS